MVMLHKFITAGSRLLEEAKSADSEYFPGPEYFTSPEFFDTLITIGICLGVFFILIGIQSHIRKKLAAAGEDAKYNVVKIIFNIAKIFILLLGIDGVLNANHMGTNVFVVFIIIVFILLALTLKDAIADLIAGMQILLHKNFREGDVIEYKGKNLRIDKFSFVATKCYDVDARDTLTLLNRELINTTVKSGYVVINMGFGYENDAKKIHDMMLVIKDKIAEIEEVESSEFRGIQNFKDEFCEYSVGFTSKPVMCASIRRKALKVIQDITEAPDGIPMYEKVHKLMNVD